MSRSDFSQIPRHRDMTASPKPLSGQHHPVVIVGAGPVGLTAALELGRRGHRVLVLNQFDFISGGSKAICFSKRTLDIWNRLDVGHEMVDKGVVWNVGKVFRGDATEPIYEFDVLADKAQEMPGFINLQQYLAEDILVNAISEIENIELRWGHEVTAIETSGNKLTIETDEGPYTLLGDWILACDGAKSPLRTMIGLDFDGRVFEDNFLIADVRFEDRRPSERWFWFDPPWGGASALLHKQPDDVWRLDFQLGWDIDRDAAIKPENVEPFIKGMIGETTPFKPEWYSVYTFQCRRMDRFVHDHIIFLGDAAHIVSPFGARGCNGGVADVDNLSWKLDAVLRGGNEGLIETYNDEAIASADENILNSSRSTDFMTPKTKVSKSFRDAVLDLAEHYEFARPFVNSGRLSTAISYPKSPLSTLDTDLWSGGVMPGSPIADIKLRDGWLLQRLKGQWALLSSYEIPDAPLDVILLDEHTAQKTFDLADGGAYLVRPDQYVAARWKHFSLSKLEQTKWAA